MSRIIAIGDIHGCYYTLLDLLSKIGYESAADTLIFLGDYIDRGYHSYEVVSTLRHLQSQVGKEKVICLKGNHEQMAIYNVKLHDPETWEYNGGRLTEASFARNGSDFDDYIGWFRTMPVFCETREYLFCHAGLSHPMLEYNTEDDLLWGRDWLKNDTRQREKKVIFGHTPNPNGKAYRAGTGDLCLDSACVYGGSLCAFIIKTENGSTTKSIEYAKKSAKDCDY